MSEKSLCPHKTAVKCDIDEMAEEITHLKKVMGLMATWIIELPYDAILTAAEIQGQAGKKNVSMDDIKRCIDEFSAKAREG